MGCPSFCYLGDNLKFTITTHDPDTGVRTNADSAPTYRVYEDEDDTAILTGTMDRLDSANTTGFYSEIIAGTTANGFEDTKTYSVYIEATVDGDTGAISYDFKIINKIVEGTYTEQDVLKILLAYTGGKADGGGTATVTFRDTDDSKDRVVQTVDSNGNRSSVVLDVS